MFEETARPSRPKRICPFASRVARDESGVTAIVVSLSLTALMGFSGLAVDVGLWYTDKRAAQGAADSAAYSAAIDQQAGDISSAVVSQAKAVAGQYGLVDGSGGVLVVVNMPPTTGPNVSTPGAVEVIITKQEQLLFSNLFVSSTKIAARAVAIPGSQGGKYCVQALDPGGSGPGTGATLSNGAHIDLTQCGIDVNAAGSAALIIDSGAKLDATTVSVVGNYAEMGGAQLNVSGKTNTSAPPVADPYANVAMPTPSAPIATNASYSAGGSTYHLSPGTYQNGLAISDGVTVTLAPGVYIVEGGSFSIGGGSTLTGTGVTIVLTGSGGNYATAQIGNGANVSLSAPTSGPTSGLAIFQDRSAPTSGTNNIEGGAKMNVTGALYFPNQTVNFANGSTNSTSCTQLIAYDLTFAGGSKFGNSCAGLGVAGIGGTGTNLVE